MILKFIGEDGSMGLKKGKYYRVSIKSDGKYICVYWISDGKSNMCSYSSPQALVLNWIK